MRSMEEKAELESLVERFQSGDEAAFDELVRLLAPRVYRFCVSVLREADEAFDAAQDVFCRLHRGLSGFERRSAFSTWFRTLMLNVCRSRLKRRAARRWRPVESSVLDRRPSTCEDPEGEAERAELRRLVMEELERLGDSQREILLLREVEGLSYEEIAEVLGLEMGTVKSRLFRARAALGARLRKRLGR